MPIERLLMLTRCFIPGPCLPIEGLHKLNTAFGSNNICPLKGCSCSQVAFRDWQVDGGSSGQCAHRQGPEEHQPHLSPPNGQPLAGTPSSTLASVTSACFVADPRVMMYFVSSACSVGKPESHGQFVSNACLVVTPRRS